MIAKQRVPESTPLDDASLAAYYSRMANRYMRFPLKRLVSRIKALGVVEGIAVDVGTGPGVFPIGIAQQIPGLEFIGLDISAAMIKEAKANARQGGVVGRVHFQIGSAYQLPLKAKSVDLLLCVHTLHHLADPLAFLNEAARVLKKGGKYVIVDLRRDAPMPIAIFFDLLWRIFVRQQGAREAFWGSLKAALSAQECAEAIRSSHLPEARVYTQAVEVWAESL